MVVSGVLAHAGQQLVKVTWRCYVQWTRANGCDWESCKAPARRPGRSLGGAVVGA